MNNETRIAKEIELAQYPDGTLVHVGLVTGHNDGIDETGFDHKAFFEAQKANKVYPHRIEGIRVKAVRQHINDGKQVKPHWSAFAEDIERVLNDPESKYHKMAKDACIALLLEGNFNQIVKTPIPMLQFGGCQAELPIMAGGQQHYADVGLWDERFPQMPIAMEITYTSKQTKERILRLSQAGVHVYEFNILDRTRDALKCGVVVDVDFYRSQMMSNRFRLKSDTEVVNLLDAEYIRVAELIAEQKRKMAMDRAVEIASRNIHAMERLHQLKKRMDLSEPNDEQKREMAMDRAVEIYIRNMRRYDDLSDGIDRNSSQHLTSYNLEAKQRELQKNKFPYGTALGLGLMPITWTGRVVSMADWHSMTDWQKHGPNGREWSGVTKQWETPEC